MFFISIIIFVIMFTLVFYFGYYKLNFKFSRHPYKIPLGDVEFIEKEEYISLNLVSGSCEFINLKDYDKQLPDAKERGYLIIGNTFVNINNIESFVFCSCGVVKYKNYELMYGKYGDSIDIFKDSGRKTISYEINNDTIYRRK